MRQRRLNKDHLICDVTDVVLRTIIITLGYYIYTFFNDVPEEDYYYIYKTRIVWDAQNKLLPNTSSILPKHLINTPQTKPSSILKKHLINTPQTKPSETLNQYSPNTLQNP